MNKKKANAAFIEKIKSITFGGFAKEGGWSDTLDGEHEAKVEASHDVKCPKCGVSHIGCKKVRVRAKRKDQLSFPA